MWKEVTDFIAQSIDDAEITIMLAVVILDPPGMRRGIGG
jgi:hypothetical protein